MPLNNSILHALTQERKSLVTQLQEMESIKQRLQAIDVLLQTPNGQVIALEMKTSMVENKNYDKHWVWEDKCLFVLKEMGKAYSQQIAEKIISYEPGLDKSRSRSKTAYVMSHLFRDAKVKKIGQTGKKYLFAPL